ncbi:MAG: nicotinate-nucleotide adenylyltransferase [Candidatus Marinimicrobia bacterium]|nr:nicotinate-nucleotide adenylyltransferase [Candidatus Neomarinimicrobiota bacterium]MDP6594163.1 nicotinate-nucleotide adenylyltransferase [Candidatus Neomarinimicrobiota bacterium]MDP6835641.1 nicotinate-nucleotide adenylyltransferase [Candidatus Neomarinimicrobiota bacterium]
MRICLFGGTFDPPHIGHLIIAETIKESERFDKMIFVPAFHPPHKNDSNLSSIEDRLEMLRLSVSHDETFELSDIEIERGGISYTIDTILELKSRYSLTKRDIYFLMGSDSLLQFHIWKDHLAILKECRVLVAIRPGFRSSRIAPDIMAQIRFANMPQFEISSSQIRRKARSGQTIRYMVLDPVWKYIQEKGLYE